MAEQSKVNAPVRATTLINDVVLKIKKVVTSNREIKKKLINKKFIFYFFLLAYALTHEQIKLWHDLLQGW